MKICGQSSWRVISRDVEAFVTEQGGHLAPVTFDRTKRKIQPYSVAPWAEEKVDPALPTILKVLRGDFFCMPFGGNAKPFRGEKYPVHGETANSKWKIESLKPGRLHVSLQTKARKGRVDKIISLRDGENAVYSQHLISGMSGPMNLGHHATVQFPDYPGSGVISTSPYIGGQVFPGQFEKPEEKGYQSLKPGAEFKSLTKVPMICGEMADLTKYPARRGFEDLAMIFSDTKQPFAWTAVTFPKERYVWFALKDPRVLRSTIFWITNGGRYGAPWSGRHTSRMGLEEVTSYFHVGLAEAAGKNSLSAKGIATCLQLDPKKPTAINYIMAVALVPAGFDRVADITADVWGESVTLRSDSGKKVCVPLNVGFLTQ